MPAVTTISLDRLTDVERFVDFVKSCYRPRHILSDPGFLRWQFATPWEHDSGLYVIENRAGKVLAHNAGVAVPFWAVSRVAKGRMSMSLMSRPEVRGFGLGIGVVRHVQEEAEITLALAMSDESLALHEGLGFVPLGILNRYLYVTSESAIQPLLDPARMRAVPPFALPNITPLGEVFAGVLDDTFTTLFQRSLGDRFAVQRSGRYLEWRYREMPFYDYEIRAAMNSDGVTPRGVLIWRRDVTEPTDAVAGRIVELFGEENVLPGLVAGVIEQARHESVAYIDAFFSAEIDGRPLTACGFQPATGEYERLVTNWTHPAAHTDNALAYGINTAVFVKHPESTDWRNRERWYITKSDSDQDRPAQLPS